MQAWDHLGNLNNLLQICYRLFGGMFESNTTAKTEQGSINTGSVNTAMFPTQGFAFQSNHRPDTHSCERFIQRDVLTFLHLLSHHRVTSTPIQQEGRIRFFKPPSLPKKQALVKSISES